MAAAQLPSVPGFGDLLLVGRPVYDSRRYVAEVSKKITPGEVTPGDFEPQEHLICERLTLAACPSKSSATFRVSHGQIKYQGRDEFLRYDETDYQDQFVRIREIPGHNYKSRIIWTGRFYQQEHESFGAASPGTVGDEKLLAYGLEQELERRIVTGAWVQPTKTSSDAVKVDTPLTFNLRGLRQYDSFGNRSVNYLNTPKGNFSAPVFAVFRDGGSSTAKVPSWTAYDAVIYLLRFYGPPEIYFDVSGQVDGLKAIEPVALSVEGMSLFDALNAVIDRRRGLGWYVHWDSEGSQNNIDVRVFHTFRDPITVRGKKVTGNNTAIDFDLTKLGHLPKQCSVTVDSFPRVGTIIVRGEPVVACFSASFKDKNLAEAWDQPSETLFKTGLPAADRVGIKIDQWRSLARFRNIYTHFLIPDAWNWKASDGQGGGGAEVVNPGVDKTGKLDFKKPPAARVWGRRFLTSLPILSQQAAESTVTDVFEPQFEKFSAYIRNAFRRWVLTDRTADIHAIGGTASPLSHCFGAEINFGSQEAMAKGHLGGAIPGSGTAGAIYDYKDLIVTGAVHLDQRISVTEEIANAPKERVKVIDVRGAQTWFIATGTVIGVDSGGNLIHQKKQEILRDDSDRLKEIAQLARQWYGLPRSNLSIAFDDVASWLTPGTFIKRVTDGQPNQAATADVRDVNSVLSEIVLEFEEHRSTIRTAYAELDFAEHAAAVYDFGPVL